MSISSDLVGKQVAVYLVSYRDEENTQGLLGQGTVKTVEGTVVHLIDFSSDYSLENGSAQVINTVSTDFIRFRILN